jgi:hypothetical protein
VHLTLFLNSYITFRIYVMICAFKFRELIWNLDAWSLGLLCCFTSMLGR